MLDLPPPVPAIEFSLASSGMSKGAAQTDGPQFLARGELSFGRLYLGAYAKNVTSTSAEGEAAALVGVRTSIAKFEVAASAGLKRAIEPAGGSDSSALEVGASVSRRFGPVTPRFGIVWSPDDVGSTGQSLFVDSGASYRLAKTVTASAAIGRRERSGGLDYTAWNGGVSWTPEKHVTLDLRYYDTNRGDDHTYKARLVVSGRVKF